MSDKDLKKIELMIKKALNDVLMVEDSPSVISYGNTMFPIAVLDEIEAFLGESIEFMGIS